MTKLNVTGMSCNHCRGAVKSALEEVAGVKAVQVDLAGGTAEVEGAADIDELVAAVRDAGYEATVAVG